MKRSRGRPDGSAERPDLEEAALQSLLALEAVWKWKHRGHVWQLDESGQGPSRVTLADLGLDARLRELRLIGLCPRHAQFVDEWTGLGDAEPPPMARCSVVEKGERCELYSRVFLIEPDERAA